MCPSSDCIDSKLAPESVSATGDTATRRELRTYFFNFAHVPEHRHADCYLIAGGQRYQLDSVQDQPQALQRHRMDNGFLRGVPDHQITHVAENVSVQADYVTMAYIGAPTGTSGAWSMYGMYLLPPSSGVLAAAQRAQAEAPGGKLPLSAKRALYGMEPAGSVAEAIEEAILLDPVEHATAIVGLHPDLLGVDGGSGARVQNLIQQNAVTTQLAVYLQAFGPATPETTPGQPNPSGWATLTPILDPNGQPYRNVNGKNQGWIQYHPAWRKEVRDTAQSMMSTLVQRVKNDASLGRNVTGADPDQPGSPGVLWKRHDGFTTVDQSPGAYVAQDDVQFTLVRNSLDSGFALTGTGKAVGDSVQATLTFTNWFVRWLGIYLLFLDGKGNPIKAKEFKIDLPPDYSNQSQDTPDLEKTMARFAALLGPEFTVLGIPVAASTASIGVNIPSHPKTQPTVRTVRVFASGPSFNLLGGVDPHDMETWGDWYPGMITTLIFNYGLTVILMCAGACSELSVVQKAAIPWVVAVVKAIPSVIGDELRNQDFSGSSAWEAAAKTIAKSFLGTLLTKSQTVLWSEIMAAVAVGEAEDCIPIVGQIAQAISLVAGAVTLFETTVEIAESPVSYVYDLQWSHSPSLAIEHDPKNTRFPPNAAYYKLTAQLSDGGTPFVQTLQMPGGDVQSLPAVTFQNLPYGGNVTVTVGFYSSNDELLAKGGTGSVANTAGVLPTIVIEEFPAPINARTAYTHARVTVLNEDGALAWLPTPTPPPVEDLVCETAPGNLCKLRNITVRQGTNAAPGFVGYAFQSSSRSISACGSGDRGQLDQLVNMGADNPNEGYVTAGCGYLSGAMVSYSLFPGGGGNTGVPASAASNFYLDTTSGLVRGIRLDRNPPRFDPITQGVAYGALRLPSDSLVLHPSGRLVSVNTTFHKMEILKLPSQPLADSEAKIKLRAYAHCGRGQRPGLLSQPKAVAISPDGVVLVLEQGNDRIQAFDVGANPVRLFKQQPQPYFLELSSTVGSEYLDLAVEYTGYLYVLSRSGDAKGFRYRLDIYHPGQQTTAPISTTFDVNSGRIAVDYWRNVYTLNYQVLRLPAGGLPDVTQPSISRWTPASSA